MAMKKETELKFSQRFFEDIRSGKKRITIRLGLRDYPPEVCFEDRALKIDSVTHHKLKDIPDRDLLDDGFSSLREALIGLSVFYHDITPETKCTVVRFHLQ